MSEGTENTTAKPQGATACATPGKGLALFALLLAVIGCAGVAGGGYWGYQQISSMKQTQSQQSNLATEWEAAQVQASTEQALQQAAVEKLQSNIESRLNLLKREVASAAQHKLPAKTQWIFAETLSLLKLANERLTLEGDLRAAITLLEGVSAQLKSVDTLAANEVRDAVVADLVALKSIPPVDVEGTWVTLGALIDQLNDLPLQYLAPKDEASDEDIQQVSHAAWKRALNKSWQELKSLVRVRRHHEAVMPLVSPEERGYLVQNLHLQLENARWAVLHRHPKIYRESLATAGKWLDQYYKMAEPLPLALKKQIEALQRVPVRQEVPNLARAISATRHALEQLAQG